MSNGSSLEQQKAIKEKELELSRLDKEEANIKKEIAESQAAEAKAKKAKLEAEIPSGKSQPVEGKITADEKSGYVATLAAYKAMIQKAGTIANEIEKQNLGNSPRLLIVDSLDFCVLDVQLIQVLNQLSFWKSELHDQIQRIQFLIKAISAPGVEPMVKKRGVMAPLTEAPAVIGGIVSSIADIVGYFRVDYEIKGQAISLSNTALQALVASRIDKKKYPVYLPAFHRFESPEKITVINKLNDCIKSKGELKRNLYELKVKLSSAYVENKRKNGTTKEKKQISDAEMGCKKAEDIINEFAEFNKAVTSVPQGGGYSPIASAAIRQYLNDIGVTHLLYLNVTSSGGEMVIGKGLFQWGNIGYLGGCVITYVLARCSGEIIAANTLIGYSKVMYKLCSNKLSKFEPG